MQEVSLQSLIRSVWRRVQKPSLIAFPAVCCPALPPLLHPIVMSEVEETLERIKAHKGVEGVIIVNADGIPIRPAKGMDDELTHKYAANISQLAAKARSVIRDLDPQNDLTFLRIRSKKHEIMVAPDKEFLLVVIQDPTISNKK